MALERISISEFVRQIRRALQARRLTFLTGAGVSMLPPSNLPSGAALKDFAVRTLCACDPLRSRWREIARNPRYKRITPEILFERLYGCLGETTFLNFFNVLGHARANSAHRLLRELSAKSMCRVLTTNFDLLIESPPMARGAVIHLHGALDRPEAMVTRINQVGRGLNAKVQKSIQRVMSASTLCVLGYSGADGDVSTAVQASAVDQILWLVRRLDDPAWRNLQQFARKHHVRVAVADLRLFFRKLGDVAFRNDASANQQEAERRRSLAAWLEKARVVDRYSCLSEIFFEIEDYRAAASISEEAFRISDKTELAGWFRTQAANSHKVLGNFDRAAKLAREAIQLNRRVGDPFDIAASYNVYGSILAEKTKPDLKRAKRALKKAVVFVESIDLTRCRRQRADRIRNFHARVLNNLGLALSHTRQIKFAVSTYRKSLAIKRNLGDLLGIALTSGNISLAYLRGGNFSLATRWRARALEISDKYQLGFQKAYVLRQTGVLMSERGDLVAGREFLLRALTVYDEIGQARFGKKLTEQALKKYARRTDH